ncbi:hypothetical protein P691DRAFT_713081, partial [Macrolepiota fuliginosa MF-IS2]
MFSGAHALVLNNSHFIDQQAGQSGIEILREASNPDASYDSSARDPAPRCFPGTREQHVEDTIHWAVPTVGADDSLPLFWMKGPAGVGKSAVAQTCVEKLKAMGKLGAAFFFAVNKTDKAEQFFPTIVYQLATEFPDYRDLVDQRIRHDRTILYKTMATQFRVLVVELFQELEMKGQGIRKRVAIFIDGLDECEDVDAQCDIIKIIAIAARDRTIPFCWAFFSRPEAHIEGTFAIDDVARITRTALLPVSRDADGDVELYLRGGFANILQRRNISLKSPWPSDEDIRTLTRAANGLFIYVATALRFIGQPGSLPEESLYAILATIPNYGSGPMITNTHSSPFAELDAFYMLIMQRIPLEILPTVLLFLHFLCAFTSDASTNRRSVLFMSNALGLSELTFKAVYNHLSAVVHFQDEDGFVPPYHDADTGRSFKYANSAIVSKLGVFIASRLGGSISFYHKSFYDFLIDSTRSDCFSVASLAMYNAWFKRCLELRLKYEESLCFHGSGESN